MPTTVNVSSLVAKHCWSFGAKRCRSKLWFLDQSVFNYSLIAFNSVNMFFKLTISTSKSVDSKCWTLFIAERSLWSSNVVFVGKSLKVLKVLDHWCLPTFELEGRKDGRPVEYRWPGFETGHWTEAPQSEVWSQARKALKQVQTQLSLLRCNFEGKATCWYQIVQCQRTQRELKKLP